MTPRSIKPLTLVALACYCLQSVSANDDNQVQAYANGNGNHKDDTYYAQGMANPNAVADSMYWKDGRHVLADIDQFESLYIQYHNCAYEPSWGNQDDNGGGGGGGDNDVWYVGSTPPELPNVAFSLYGVPTGSTNQNENHPCNKHTFINSFHTTYGVESFTNALNAAGMTDLFPYQDGDQDQNDDNNQADIPFVSTCTQIEDDNRRKLEDNANVQNGQAMDGYATSYGVGCNAEHPTQFALQTYHGGYCQVGTNGVVSVDDTMEDMNAKLENNVQCIQIYKQGENAYANNQDNNKDDDEAGSPLLLLTSSHACYFADADCPDPYGKLRKYANQLRSATHAGASVPWWTPYHAMVTSYVFFSVGGLLTLLATALLVKECCARRTNNNSDSTKTVDHSKSLEEDIGPVEQHEHHRGGKLLALTKGLSRSMEASSTKLVALSTAVSRSFNNNNGKEVTATSFRNTIPNDKDDDNQKTTPTNDEEPSVASAGVAGVIGFIQAKSQELFADEEQGQGDDKYAVGSNNNDHQKHADTKDDDGFVVMDPQQPASADVATPADKQKRRKRSRSRPKWLKNFGNSRK